tara:strand:- start:4321 stop:4995 length:675 start_codon:yes stop_codon:yes gene_type:complete
MLNIGIIGGTGSLGKGLALRWSKNNNVLLGSRDLSKAKRLASEYLQISKSFYGNNMLGNITGTDNNDLVSSSEIIVFSVPYQNCLDTAQLIKPHIKKDTIIISPINYLEFGGNLSDYSQLYNQKSSLAESISKILPESDVVSTFHTIPAHQLSDLEYNLNCDVFVASDNMDSYYKVAKLIEEIPKLIPIYSGFLSSSLMLESLTQFLLNIGKINKIKSPSLKIV